MIRVCYITYVNISNNMYLYMCVYTHTHTHIYIHIHIHMKREKHTHSTSLRKERRGYDEGRIECLQYSCKAFINKWKIY